MSQLAFAFYKPTSSITRRHVKLLRSIVALDNGTGCYCKTAYLAKEIKATPRTAQRWLKILADHGLILVALSRGRGKIQRRIYATEEGRQMVSASLVSHQCRAKTGHFVAPKVDPCRTVSKSILNPKESMKSQCRTAYAWNVTRKEFPEPNTCQMSDEKFERYLTALGVPENSKENERRFRQEELRLRVAA